jgi:hypothetical protein
MADASTPTTSSPRPGTARRTHEAQLLELGALVYELHRRGRRAPELLQEKASALDQTDTGLRFAGGPPIVCPRCHSAGGPGQLVCLECGRPLALRRTGRPPGRPPLLAAAAALVCLLGATAFGFALSDLTGGGGDGGDRAAARAPAPRAASEGAPSGGVAAAEQSAQAGGPVALAAWPAAGGTAYTVVLVTSSDEAGARRVAQEAVRSGLEAGLVRSDEFRDLGEGLWIVWAGRYPDATAAGRRAERLGERYPGAYAQRLAPAG